MPRGDKSSYTDKQKRKAEHIEEGYEDRGVGHKEAERRAWATVNKESGGGKNPGRVGERWKTTRRPRREVGSAENRRAMPIDPQQPRKVGRRGASGLEPDMV